MAAAVCFKLRIIAFIATILWFLPVYRGKAAVTSAAATRRLFKGSFSFLSRGDACCSDKTDAYSMQSNWDKFSGCSNHVFSPPSNAAMSKRFSGTKTITRLRDTGDKSNESKAHPSWVRYWPIEGIESKRTTLGGVAGLETYYHNWSLDWLATFTILGRPRINDASSDRIKTGSHISTSCARPWQIWVSCYLLLQKMSQSDKRTENN